MPAFGYRGFNPFEWLCIGFSFVSAGLAAFGVLIIVLHFFPHPRSGFPAVLLLAVPFVFFSALALMLHGVDKLKNDRFQRLIKAAEARQNSN